MSGVAQAGVQTTKGLVMGWVVLWVNGTFGGKVSPFRACAQTDAPGEWPMHGTRQGDLYVAVSSTMREPLR